MKLHNHITVPKLTIISGHHFGQRVLEGLTSSLEYRSKQITIELVLALHPMHAPAIAGYANLAASASNHNLCCRTFHRATSPEVSRLLKETPHDFLLAIGLSQLIPSQLLDLPRDHNRGSTRHDPSYGCIGMHPTLLPIGRGRAPIPWTIIKGLTQSGVSAFLLEEDADSGGIVMSEEYPIRKDETSESLYKKAANAHKKLGERLASVMSRRALMWTDQDESKATTWAKRTPADGWIDFTSECETIQTQVRALTSPYPPAFFVQNNMVFPVASAHRVVKQEQSPPGTILQVDTDGSPTVAAQDGALLLRLRTSTLPPLCAGERVHSPETRYIAK